VGISPTVTADELEYVASASVLYAFPVVNPPSPWLIYATSRAASASPAVIVTSIFAVDSGTERILSAVHIVTSSASVSRYLKLDPGLVKIVARPALSSTMGLVFALVRVTLE
jgi:hypothetical protein